MRKAALALAGLALAIAAAAAIHVRRDVVPPGCSDPVTLAALHDMLVHRFGLPDNVRLERIETHAGGPLAFRFLCSAELAGLAHAILPPGPRPGSVSYSTRLTATGHGLRLHAVLSPLLQWVQVQ